MELVSVIVPAYNASATLEKTLLSILSQTHEDIEVIVVDDGSTDSTPDLVRQFAQNDGRLTLFQQRNAGVAAARNRGIEAASGTWVAPVDADDLWHPSKIELQVRAAERQGRDAVMAYSWSRRIDDQDRVMSDMGMPRNSGAVYNQLVASNFMRNASSAMFRRDAAIKVGGFDSGLQKAGAQGAEDLKLYLAISRQGQVAVAPHFLTGYRFLDESMSQDSTRMRRSIEMVLRSIEAEGDEFNTLLKLARMNYDLYAAALALAGNDRAAFVNYVWSALKRRPLDATILLAVNSVWRISGVFRSKKSLRKFGDMGMDERTPMVLSEWFSDYQTRAARRAARHLLPRADALGEA